MPTPARAGRPGATAGVRRGRARPAERGAATATAAHTDAAHRLTPEAVATLQRLAGNRATSAVLARSGQTVPATGAGGSRLPAGVRARAEEASGVPLVDVRVHHDSPNPARFHALAYTQGSDIHVGPGQGAHLAHEAWHVAQQRQGRVRSTTDVNGTGLNDDARLEREAEEFGAGRRPAGDTASSTAVPLSGAAPVQLYDPYGLALMFGQRNVADVKAHLGDATFAYLLRQDPRQFQQLLPIFQAQRALGPIVDAAGQGDFLLAHSGTPAGLALATLVLGDLRNVATNAAANFALLEPYDGAPDFSVFHAALAQRGNDPTTAAPVLAFLALHRGSDVELALAGEALRTANDLPGPAAGIYDYLACYHALGPADLTAARRVLASKANDPLAAEETMTATKEHGYFESVTAGAQKLAAEAAGADIDTELAAIKKDRDEFASSYETAAKDKKVTSALTSNEAKAGGKELSKLFGLSADKFDGNFRDKVNKAREGKLAGFASRTEKAGQSRAGLEQTYGASIATALKPLYAFGCAEAAANWCLEQAGTSVDQLRVVVGLMTACLADGLAVLPAQQLTARLQGLELAHGLALVEHRGSYERLVGLSPERGYALIEKLASSHGGDLDVGALARLVERLQPLDGPAVDALVSLLTPGLTGAGIAELLLGVGVPGDEFDMFVRRYVPTITSAQFASLANALRPLPPAEIDALVNRLHPSLPYADVVTLLSALRPLDGPAVRGLVDKLQTDAGPLTGKQIRELVRVMDGAPGDDIDAVVTRLGALGEPTGKSIYAKVEQMRGTMKVGGVRDVTTLGGERVLTGPQIAIRTGQVAAGGLGQADLMTYPHSNINPVGRGEDMLWKDCDPAISRHAAERPDDVAIRQRLALSALCALPGVSREVVQQVFAVQHGQRPRAMMDADGEDALSKAAGDTGHIRSRHVIGCGLINTTVKLQNRADGVGDLPPCPGIAGAFANMAASQVGMHNAMQAAVAAGSWPNIRRSLVRKLAYEMTLVATVSGYVARAGQPLNNAPTRVYLPVTGANVAGGFYVFHSWPLL